MKNFLLVFEKLVVGALVAMMMLTILIATGELGWLLVKDLIEPPLNLLTINELLEVFGFFMIVLIGIELLDTVKAYVTEQHIRVEAVLMVAIIALARKVIVLDLDKYSAPTLFALAALLLALSAGYFFLRHRSTPAAAAPPT